MGRVGRRRRDRRRGSWKVLTENRVGHFASEPSMSTGPRSIASSIRVSPTTSESSRRSVRDDSPESLFRLASPPDHRRREGGRSGPGPEPYLARHAPPRGRRRPGSGPTADAGFPKFRTFRTRSARWPVPTRGLGSRDGPEVVAVTAPPAPGFWPNWLLCLTARRLGCRFADSAAAFLPAGRLAPDWATGENSRGPRHTLTGHTGGDRSPPPPPSAKPWSPSPVAAMGRSWSDLGHWRTPVHLDRPHPDWVRAVTTTIGETPVAVTRSNDGQGPGLGPDTGERRHALTGHIDWVRRGRHHHHRQDPGRRHWQQRWAGPGMGPRRWRSSAANPPTPVLR